MSRLLVLAGTVLSLLGLALIPLPGPGYPALVVGVPPLVAGLVTRLLAKRGSGQAP